MRTRVVDQATMTPKTPASAKAIDRDIPELRQRYEFRELDDIEGFLERHPDLIDLLREAQDRIAVLAPEGKSTLELIVDPEDEEDDGELFIVVPTRVTPSEARERLDHFRRDWLICTAQRSDALLNVTLRYV